MPTANQKPPAKTADTPKQPSAETELLLQLLRTMRSETSHALSQLRDTVRDLAEEARITNAHMVGLIRNSASGDSRITKLQKRIQELEELLSKREGEGAA